MFKKKQVVKEASQNTETAKPEAKSETNVVAKKRTSKSISSWIYQPLLLLIGVAISFFLIVETLSLKPNEEAVRDKLIKYNGEVASHEIDAYFERVSRVLVAIAKNTESTAESIESLKVLFPELQGVYYVKSDELKDIKVNYPDISFASLDLVRSAVESGKESVEAFYNKQWYFHIVIPQQTFNTDGSIARASYILAEFDTTELKRIVKSSPVAQTGRLDIVTAQGRPVVGRGEGNERNKVSVDTVVPQWKVEFSLRDGYQRVVDRTLLGGGLLGTVLVFLIALFILLRTNMAKIRSDIQAVAQYVSRLAMSGKSQKSVQFAELSTLADALAEHVKELKNAVSNVASNKGDIDVPNNVAPSTDGLEVPGDDAPLFDDDLLDLDALEGTEDVLEEQSPMVEEVQSLEGQITKGIFRAYDIRGIVDETLNESVVELIGKAIASEAIAQGQTTLCVGYDGRLSSVAYCEALSRGITSTGIDVIVIGQVPTPVLYFATHQFETGSGVMITGSHNPGNYNGFKIMIAGKTLSGEDIQRLYDRIVIQDFAQGQGQVSEQAVVESYMDTILNDIAVAAPLKVVLDAGNGVAGGIAPGLIEELGCEVIPLYCEVDGNFPNHHPDPGKPENLQDLIAAVQEHDADLGLAFDGDGDRVGVVTNTGKIIWPDRLLMLFAKDVVSRNPGADILFDVKCSRRLNGLISSYGGRPVMWKTGHSLIKAKMKETGALLAGEMSGHIFFKERWFGFDDGIYSAVRLLEILGIEDRTSDEVFADFPEDISTPEINITVTDETKFELIEKLCLLKGAFEGGNVSTIDGLRVDFPNGWGLCRASNTTPVLVLRFEADDDAALEEIKEKFKAQLRAVDESLNLDF